MSPMMKTSNPPTKVVYHDNSLSSFVTGLAFGAVAALILGTEEGRQLTKKLKKNLSEVTKDLEPNLQNLPQKTTSFVNTVREFAQDINAQTQTPPNLASRLHRTPGTTFTQQGRPL